MSVTNRLPNDQGASMSTKATLLASDQVGTLSLTAGGKALCGAHGTREALDLVSVFEDHGVFCYLIGVSVLIFYGAGRIRHVCCSLQLAMFTNLT